MSNPLASATSVAIPAGASIARIYPTTDLADAFSIPLPPGATADPERLARFIFAQQAPWVSGLMKMRDALVSPFGLKTAKQLTAQPEGAASPRVGIFRIYGKTADEILLGEDDRHLDFRVSVHVSEARSPAPVRQLTVSTVVHCHNALGRSYILLIAPFHRRVVQSMLERAARAGWPAASDT
ncbi:MAG: DUF2867 domain-containing protein [Ramlibacter sp.]|nr:DUF2867 domain-containing protein [Ramlibacter sp.]